MVVKIGVLSLQGNFDMHCQILNKIGIESVNVRYPAELDEIEGLIIPGGESTTISKLMKRVGFYDLIREFAQDYPIFGTCAGLILMSEKIIDEDLESLGILDATIERNGYGRQIFSNTEKIEFIINKQNHVIKGSFIRAPKILSTGKSIDVIATFKGDPIIIKNSKHMGIAFHPELDNISFLHEYIFLGDGTKN